MEFYYNKGVVSIQVLEDKYVTVEAFPNNQTSESYESAEFDNLFKIETWKNLDITGYELNLPTDMTDTEKQELLSVVQKYAHSI